MKTCVKCKKELPATTEYFNKHNTYPDGLNIRCNICTRKLSREYYYKNRKPIKPKREKTKKERLFEDELSEQAEKGYKKLISQPRDYGIGHKLDKVKLDKSKQYIILQANDKQGLTWDKVFEGKYLSDTDNLIVLRHKLGYTETFRKYDILSSEYQLKEVQR